jgi:hypothetical protein
LLSKNKILIYPFKAFVKSDLELRVEALEKKFYTLLESEIKDEKGSGPAEIRTQDPRRVKAMS